MYYVVPPTYVEDLYKRPLSFFDTHTLLF